MKHAVRATPCLFFRDRAENLGPVLDIRRPTLAHWKDALRAVSGQNFGSVYESVGASAVFDGPTAPRGTGKTLFRARRLRGRLSRRRPRAPIDPDRKEPLAHAGSGKDPMARGHHRGQRPRRVPVLRRVTPGSGVARRANVRFVKDDTHRGFESSCSTDAHKDVFMRRSGPAYRKPTYPGFQGNERRTTLPLAFGRRAPWSEDCPRVTSCGSIFPASVPTTAHVWAALKKHMERVARGAGGRCLGAFRCRTPRNEGADHPEETQTG